MAVSGVSTFDDMIAFAERVISYTMGLDQKAFVANGLVYDATLRNLELIGEAATHVPDAVRAANPQVPWRLLVATRNRLIHGYLGIDQDTLWQPASECPLCCRGCAPSRINRLEIGKPVDRRLARSARHSQIHGHRLRGEGRATARRGGHGDRIGARWCAGRAGWCGIRGAATGRRPIRTCGGIPAASASASARRHGRDAARREPGPPVIALFVAGPTATRPS